MTVIESGPPPSNSTPTNPPPHDHPAKTRHVLLLVLGVLLVSFGLALSGAIAPLGAMIFQQGREGYITSPAERFTVDSYAITSEQLEVVIDEGLGSAQSGPVASMMLRGTSAAGQDIFLGVGPRADVQAYLAEVEHSELVQVEFAPFKPTYRTVAGTKAPTRPAEQDFWTVSAQGPGSQQVEMDVRTGTWSVVIMNADGSRPIAVDLQAGLSSPFLVPVATGAIVAGVLSLLLGLGLVIMGAAGLGRSASGAGRVDATGHGVSAPGATTDGRDLPYAVGLSGDLDPTLSRGLWLVKWLLAFPHYVVLAFLWIAFVVSVVVSAFSVLFTGRYPRSLFDFNVGVLRWSWRVTFYAASLGTDRYPPFTLARSDYPAQLEVAYPEQMSRWLVLIKSWLLAIPHLVIIGLFTANVSYWWSNLTAWSSTGNQNTAGISLLGALGLVAGVTLLVTSRYPQPLFDLVVGLNRWVYRVLGYVGLMSDRYPPFRLDQGPHEPGHLDPPAMAGAAGAGEARR